MRLDGWTGLTVTRPDAGVLLITLDRPDRLNALSVGMKRDLVELLTQVQADDETRAVVLTGAGRAFCAGDYVHADYTKERPGSVPEIAGGHRDAASTYSALKLHSQALNRAMRAVDKPTIAAINGPTVQSGLSLALACDFRFASATARLGSGTLRFGLMPDEGGHYLLVQLLGLAGALDFLLRARLVDAPTALGLGLVTEVHDPDDVLPAAIAQAREFAAGTAARAAHVEALDLPRRPSPTSRPPSTTSRPAPRSPTTTPTPPRAPRRSARSGRLATRSGAQPRRWAGRGSPMPRRCDCAVSPPSTTIAWPVTNDDSSDDSHTAAAAISSGRPMRPSGWACSLRRRASGSPSIRPTGGVSMAPGQMQLTRICWDGVVDGQGPGQVDHRGLAGAVDDARPVALEAGHRRRRRRSCHRPGRRARAPRTWRRGRPSAR